MSSKLLGILYFKPSTSYLYPLRFLPSSFLLTFYPQSRYWQSKERDKRDGEWREMERRTGRKKKDFFCFSNFSFFSKNLCIKMVRLLAWRKKERERERSITSEVTAATASHHIFSFDWGNEIPRKWERETLWKRRKKMERATQRKRKSESLKMLFWAPRALLPAVILSLFSSTISPFPFILWRRNGKERQWEERKRWRKEI